MIEVWHSLDWVRIEWGWGSVQTMGVWVRTADSYFVEEGKFVGQSCTPVAAVVAGPHRSLC